MFNIVSATPQQSNLPKQIHSKEYCKPDSQEQLTLIVHFSHAALKNGIN